MKTFFIDFLSQRPYIFRKARMTSFPAKPIQIVSLYISRIVRTWPKGSSINDVKVLGEGGQGFCDDSCNG